PSELRRLGQAGVSGTAVLASATRNAAALAQDRDAGRLEAGAIADLLIVTGDPLARAVDLLQPIAVVSQGELRSVAGLRD
ncbi:MAG: amidohydrolase family protein, partial [Pseudomonadota bacterium]